MVIDNDLLTVIKFLYSKRQKKKWKNKYLLRVQSAALSLQGKVEGGVNRSPKIFNPDYFTNKYYTNHQL